VGDPPTGWTAAVRDPPGTGSLAQASAGVRAVVVCAAP
jgi:hypothetical protein